MEVRSAKDLLHIRDWLDRAAVIVTQGRDAYLQDALLQEAEGTLKNR